MIDYEGIVTCPRCGFESDDVDLEICPKCGLDFNDYLSCPYLSNSSENKCVLGKLCSFEGASFESCPVYLDYFFNRGV